jgi:hypothetical protein
VAVAGSDTARIPGGSVGVVRVTVNAGALDALIAAHKAAIEVRLREHAGLDPFAERLKAVRLISALELKEAP